MKHRMRGSCIRKLNCYHFRWRRSHNWVLSSLVLSFYWRQGLINQLLFIWTLRKIYVNFSINSCHLWCPIVCWNISVRFPHILLAFFSRLCYFWDIILCNATFNSTFCIFKCNSYSIAAVFIWLLLFFVWIILRLELDVGWCSNIRAVILLLLYLNRRLFCCFFYLLVLLGHDYARGDGLPSLFILWLIPLLRPCILGLRDIVDGLHWWALAVLTVMDSLANPRWSWLRIVFILINYTSLTFIYTTYVCVMWTSN